MCLTRATKKAYSTTCKRLPRNIMVTVSVRNTDPVDRSPKIFRGSTRQWDDGSSQLEVSEEVVKYHQIFNLTILVLD